MRLSILASLILTVAARFATAQTTETPVAFDSAQRVMSVTPPLVERLKLAAPAWPVQGEFREARLFAVQPGGSYVLVVQRAAGIVERYPLTEPQRSSLRAAIDIGMSVSGRPSAESGSDAISEPAGNAFARWQTLLAAAVYGPLAASLADDGAAAGALYLLVTGGTFFTTYAMAQSSQISRAQNALASRMGLAAASTTMLLGYAATGETEKGVRALALGSAVVGTVAGINLGRTMSDAEAHAAGGGMMAGAILAATTAAAFSESDRGAAAAIAGGIIAGYPIGLSYPRSTSYTVTAGDVGAVGVSGLIGGVAGAALIGEAEDRSAALAVGAGYLAGLLVGDRLIARRYDLSQSEANVVGVGAVAGGLVGLAVPTLARSDNSTFILGSVAVGAALGMAAIVSHSPHWVGGSATQRGTSDARHGAGSNSRFQVNLGGAGLLGALGKVPGRHALLQIGF